MALAQILLEEVRQTLKVLLVLIVVRDVADHHVRLFARFCLPGALDITRMLRLENFAAVLA